MELDALCGALSQAAQGERVSATLCRDPAHVSELTDSDVRRLTNALAAHGSVSRLSLQGQRIGVAAAVVLGDFMRASTALRNLDLSHCWMGSDAASQIVAALSARSGKPRSRVQTLDLAACRIGVQAMPRISRSLESVTCHLRTLVLRYNPITARGLGLLLKWAIGVVHLDCRCCGILCAPVHPAGRSVEVAFILEGLRENTACSSLLLQGNGFSPVEREQILCCVAENKRSSLGQPDAIKFADERIDALLPALRSFPQLLRKWDGAGSRRAAVAGLDPEGKADDGLWADGDDDSDPEDEQVMLRDVAALEGGGQIGAAPCGVAPAAAGHPPRRPAPQPAPAADEGGGRSGASTPCGSAGSGGTAPPRQAAPPAPSASAPLEAQGAAGGVHPRVLAATAAWRTLMQDNVAAATLASAVNAERAATAPQESAAGAGPAAEGDPGAPPRTPDAATGTGESRTAPALGHDALSPPEPAPGPPAAEEPPQRPPWAGQERRLQGGDGGSLGGSSELEVDENGFMRRRRKAQADDAASGTSSGRPRSVPTVPGASGQPAAPLQGSAARGRVLHMSPPLAPERGPRRGAEHANGVAALRATSAPAPRRRAAPSSSAPPLGSPQQRPALASPTPGPRIPPDGSVSVTLAGRPRGAPPPADRRAPQQQPAPQHRMFVPSITSPASLPAAAPAEPPAPRQPSSSAEAAPALRVSAGDGADPGGGGQRRDRVTPALLNACMAGDTACRELLGDEAYAALPPEAGRQHGVPSALAACCGLPTILNHLRLGSEERVVGIAKLLWVLTHLAPRPGAGRDAEVCARAQEVATRCSDHNFEALRRREDFDQQRREENRRARQLLRAHRNPGQSGDAAPAAALQPRRPAVPLTAVPGGTQQRRARSAPGRHRYAGSGRDEDSDAPPSERSGATAGRSHMDRTSSGRKAWVPAGSAPQRPAVRPLGYRCGWSWGQGDPDTGGGEVHFVTRSSQSAAQLRPQQQQSMWGAERGAWPGTSSCGGAPGRQPYGVVEDAAALRRSHRVNSSPGSAPRRAHSASAR